MALSTQRIFEIFWRFLLLGCMSFGGPAAHIGYFREAFVERLKWLDDVTYASLIALSQFLPGPGSSQVGFAIGLHRGGVLGGLAAFIGFTFPSMVILITLSMTSQDALADGALAQVIHGLKLFAVVIVVSCDPEDVPVVLRDLGEGGVLRGHCGYCVDEQFSPDSITGAGAGGDCRVHPDSFG